MIIDEAFDRLLDLFRPKAIAIPHLDGAMRPNTRLDEAPVLASLHEPDNVAEVGGEVWFSSGTSLQRIDLAAGHGKPEVVREFDTQIACLAGTPDGSHAVGLDDGTIIVRGLGEPVEIPSVGPDHLKCPVALCFAGPRKLVVCQGSNQVPPSQNVRDLMRAGSSGSVWMLDLDRGAEACLAEGLAWPYGAVVLPEPDGILVSESWRHRILRLRPGGERPEPVLDNLHGYPARLSRLRDGSVMLCIFAPRNRLIEFVLMEREFRQRMVETVAPEHWIAPALRTGESFLEPLQQGGVKIMGIHKPWAPTLSYGLVVHLAADGTPTASFHSRANGTRHGMTSCCEIGGRIFATSKGGHCIVELPQETGAPT